MSIRKKAGLLGLLLGVLVLCLSACGVDDGPVAGDDWRTTGVIVGSGTITRKNQQVDVLVTVSTENAVFYRDQPEQVLFDRVSFPESIPDARSAFTNISFSDRNGDGESDVWMCFVHENGERTELVWLWDPDAQYVLQTDSSPLPNNEASIKMYAGLWKYTDNALWLRVHDDATWEFINSRDEVIDSGTLWVDEVGITLHFDESGDVLQLFRAESGDLLDEVNEGILVPVDDIQPAAS